MFMQVLFTCPKGFYHYIHCIQRKGSILILSSLPLGLAILNPAAQKQIRQYADSVTELFKLMISHQKEEFANRIRTAGNAVFGRHLSEPLLLRDDLLDQYSLSSIPKSERTPNSHLSLLAMVDCWWKLGIVPYDHMICSTPLFRLWLGVVEYVFRDPKLLDECIRVAMEDDVFRNDDLEFTFAARVSPLYSILHLFSYLFHSTQMDFLCFIQ